VDATLTIVARVANGCAARETELFLLTHGVAVAAKQARSSGGQPTSGAPFLGEYSNILSASYEYCPVANSEEMP
jgi:hypothetical protein